MTPRCPSSSRRAQTGLRTHSFARSCCHHGLILTFQVPDFPARGPDDFLLAYSCMPASLPLHLITKRKVVLFAKVMAIHDGIDKVASAALPEPPIYLRRRSGGALTTRRTRTWRSGRSATNSPITSPGSVVVVGCMRRLCGAGAHSRLVLS